MKFVRSIRYAILVCLCSLTSIVADETIPPAASPTPEQAAASTAPASDHPKKEMPDISGHWQTGEGKSTAYAMIMKSSLPREFTVLVGGIWNLDGPGEVSETGSPGQRHYSRMTWKWNAETSQFECALKTRKIVIDQFEDRNRLKVGLIQDESAFQAMPEQDREVITLTNQTVLQPNWVRSAKIFDGRDSYETKSILVLASMDGLAAYNKTRGEWSNLKVDITKCSTTQYSDSMISEAFFAITIEDRVYGYSSSAGTWDELPIPPEQKGNAIKRLDNTSLSVRIGDTVYAMSPTTGKWTSSNGKPVAATQPLKTPEATASNPASDQEIPDITGYWQAGESDRSVHIRIDAKDMPDEFEAVIFVVQPKPVKPKPTPQFSYTASVNMKWTPETSQFLSDEDGRKVVITQSGNRSVLKVEMVRNEQLLTELKEEIRNSIKKSDEQIFTPTWVRTTAIFGGRDNLELKSTIIHSSAKGLSAYDKINGRWSHIDVDVTKCSGRKGERPTASDSFFSIVIDDRLYGFSVALAKWDLLSIPVDQKHKVVPIHGEDYLTVRIGETIFALSPETGKWTSSNGKPLKSTPESDPAKADASNPATGQEIPDITGLWQTGETKQSVQCSISKGDAPGEFKAHINVDYGGNRGGGMSGRLSDDDDSGPNPNFSSIFVLKWSPESSQFVNDQGTSKIVVTPTDDRNRLKINATIDEQALKGLNEKDQKLLERIYQFVFSPIWVRSIDIFNGTDSTESKNIVVLASKDGLAAYNKSRGIWSKIKVDLTHFSTEIADRPIISDWFFSIILQDRLYGFSAEAGSWDSLTIPPELKHKVAPVHNLTSLTVRIGDKFYAMSPTAGKWTSPDDPSSGETYYPADQESQSAASSKTSAQAIPDITGYWELENKSPWPLWCQIRGTEKANELMAVFFLIKDVFEPEDIATASFSLSWDSQESRFKSIPENPLTVVPDMNRLRLEITRPTVSGPLTGTPIGVGLNASWVRSTDIFYGKNRLENDQVIIVASNEGLSAQNKSSGQWARIGSKLTKCSYNQASEPKLTTNFFSILVGDTFYAYCVKPQKWKMLRVPAEQQRQLKRTQSESELILEFGGKIYLLPADVPAWTSPDFPTTNVAKDLARSSPNVANAPAEKKLAMSLSIPEANELLARIVDADAAAAELAEKIRQTANEKGLSLEASREQEPTLKLWIDLKHVLIDAYDAKTKVERIRIQELQRRLKQSEALIGNRERQKSNIVTRRAIEIVERREQDATEPTAPHDASPTTAFREPRSTITLPPAETEDLIRATLGLTLVPLNDEEKNQIAKTTKYRGGMKVTQSIAPSPSHTLGLVPGDILVGLQDWETTNLDNVKWILKRLQQTSSSSNDNPDSIQVKFFFCRNGDTKYGTATVHFAETDSAPPARTEERSEKQQDDKGDDSTWSLLDRIANVGQDLISAKQEYTQKSKLFERNVLSKVELDAPALRLKTARRRLENLTDECNVKLHTASLMLEAARKAVESHQQSVAYHEQMLKGARGTAMSVLEAKRQLSTAEVAVLKLETRLKSLQRAERDLQSIAAEAKPEETKW